MTSRSSSSNCKLTGGARNLVSSEADISGTVTLGSTNVIHPRAKIYAPKGPIVFGDYNIVEEACIIYNGRQEPMVIGSSNHFQTASRIESPSVGSNNTFEPRSRVSAHTTISDWCCVASGTLVVPDPLKLLASVPVQPVQETAPPSSALPTVSEDASSEPTEQSQTTAEGSVVSETLPSETVVFGETAQRRGWPEEDRVQSRDLHRKHLVALHDVLAKSFKPRAVEPRQSQQTLSG